MSGPRVFFAAFLAGLCFFPLAGGAGEAPPRKKLLATGWDSPSADYFRQHLAEFETGPFDGTIIRPTRLTSDGQASDANPAFGPGHWDFGDFARMVADLQAAQPVNCTENFLLLNANPGNIDWFDDAGWAEIVEHWRLLARAAKQGKLRGIAYDPEAYVPPHEQFSYPRQPEHDHHTFAEYTAKARERGRAVMTAVAAEYPDITILAYFLFSNLPAPTADGKAPLALETHQSGLTPGFIDGWLDVLPATARLVDGNESSYIYNGTQAFEEATYRLKRQASAYVSAANRPKLRLQWRIAHAVYLDAYCNPPGSRWYIDPLGLPPVRRLAFNTAAALQSADDYVWIYGEKGRWWPSPMSYPLWEKKLPGITGALQRAKLQAETAR